MATKRISGHVDLSSDEEVSGRVVLRGVGRTLVVDFLNISVNYSGTISRYVSAAKLMSTKLERWLAEGCWMLWKKDWHDEARCDPALQGASPETSVPRRSFYSTERERSSWNRLCSASVR